jgi:putative ubiquitin-RnfH superfamily antitoxin RatB of RatAB toxin-antitoxin module
MPGLRVEVVCAWADRGECRELVLEEGATVRGALAAAGVQAEHGAAIYGRRVPLDTKLADGDRVEVLRPLAADPKDARRRRARQRR